MNLLVWLIPLILLIVIALPAMIDTFLDIRNVGKGGKRRRYLK